MHRRAPAFVALVALAALAASGLASPAHAVEPAPLQLQRADYVDYGLILGGLAMLGTSRLVGSPGTARLGPVYDASKPLAILDPTFAGKIGKPYAEEGAGELVSVNAATVGVAAVFGVLGAAAFAHQLAGDAYGGRGTHDAVVGFAEGALLTLGLTELLKPVVGRLRPDFADRARRYHCHPPAGEVALPDSECQGVQPLAATDADKRHLIDDGRKSFPSGHSAMSMFAATYAVGWIGGRYVWGEQATDTSRAIGLLAGGLLLTTAGFVATSRFDDGRHNLTDIVAGAGLGVAMASFSYWRRFDGRGRPRRLDGATSASLDLQGRGLSLRVAF